MSAPLSAYHSKALKDKTTPQNYLMCKFLSEYTNIKKEFYLDAILKYKDGATFYFGGACFVGSENSKHHANSRKGKIFDELEVYTDGGLNTLGDVVSITAITLWLNYTIIEIIFKSAYYVDSTNLSYSIGSGGEIALGTLSQRRSVTKTVTLLSPLGNFATPGDSFIFKAINENSEGSLKKEVNLTTRNKIWYAGGAGMNTGNGNVWKLINVRDKITNNNLYNPINGISQSFFLLNEFIALDNLPEEGQIPINTIIGYKTNQLNYGINNRFEEGFYYIYNTQEIGVPSYGNSQGTEGKVFHVNSQGEFDYHVIREEVMPFIEVTSTFMGSQLTVSVDIYIIVDGIKTAYNNDLSSNIIITGQPKWYGSVTPGGAPSGSPVVGNEFNSASFTIPVGNNSALSRNYIINTAGMNSGTYYIAFQISTTSPTDIYTINILATTAITI